MNKPAVFLSVLLLIVSVGFVQSYTAPAPENYPDLREELDTVQSKYVETRDMLGSILRAHPELMGKEFIDYERYHEIQI